MINNRELKALRSKVAVIEKTKKKLSDLRDHLREQISDLEEIAESMDVAHESLEAAISSFDDAVMEMSTLL